MSQRALAPIKWEMGQALLPSHLTEQENFLVADSALRTQSLSLPQYGLFQLAWDEALLKKGSLSLTQFCLTTPSNNHVVDYPSNTHLLSPQIELSELTDPIVYYFLLEKNINKPSEAEPKLISNGKVSRRYYKLILCSTQYIPEAFDYLLNDHIIAYQGCLASFEHHLSDEWRVTADFIPPLTSLGTTPFLLPELDQIKALLKHYREKLHSSYASDPLPIKQYVNLNNCVKSVQSTLFMLENLVNLDNKKGELKLHPYTVYQQLSSLCVELELYQGQWPDDQIISYRHEAIHTIFQHLLARLKTCLANNNSSGRSTQFQLHDTIYSAKLPPNTSRDDELYFIIKLGDMPAFNPYELPQLSSPSQLDRLYEYSLKGLTLEEVSETTINYNFGQNIQCFRIQKNQESDRVHHESGAAFYKQNLYSHYDFYIYTQNYQQQGVNHT